MRLAAVAAVVLLTGCGSSAPTAGVSRSAAPSPTASASAEETTSPSPQPSPSPSPYVLSLTGPVAPPPVPQGQCALPIYWGDAAGIHAGFLPYPGGDFVASTQTLDRHASGATYDTAAGRWLPVEPETVSPDGLRFAYAEYDLPPGYNAGMGGGARPRTAGTLASAGRVHVVDVRSGADQVLYSGSPTYSVVGFTADGIYLSQVSITMDGDFSSGLFLIKASGGTPSAVRGGDRALDRGGWTVQNGAAWGTEFSTGGGITAGNELVRLDLHTGATAKWLTAPEGTGVALLGFDPNSHPIVLTQASGYSTNGSPAPTPPTRLLIQSPSGTVLLFETSDTAAELPFGPVSSDARGAWMGGQLSVWFETANKVTKTEVAAVNSVIGVGATCQ